MTMNLIPGVESTGSALTAEKIRLEIFAQNIANLILLRMHPEMFTKEKEVAFSESHKDPASEEFKSYVDENLYQGVRVADVYDDQIPGRMIFNWHPHANDDGMVEMPNVDVSREMIDLLGASCL